MDTNFSQLSADEPAHDDQDTERDEPVNADTPTLPRRTYGLNVWVTLVDPSGVTRTEAQRGSMLYRVFKSHGWTEVTR